MTKPSLKEEIEKIVDRVYQDGMKDCERGMEVEGYIYDIATASQATSAIMGLIKAFINQEHADGHTIGDFKDILNKQLDDFTKGLE